MTDFKTLLQTFDQLLQPERFKDYGPNGLQVEGKREVQKLVSGVTASLEFIDAAIAANADAVFVHHGLFWRGQDGRVVGWMKARLQRLLAHNINVYAYHLPLDAHPELGNNAQLGQVLGLKADAWCGDQNLVSVGQPQNELTGQNFQNAQQLVDHVQQALGRSVTCIAPSTQPIRRIAWCSGGAQSYFEAAIAAGVDAFITGEISEPQAHIAKETGVAFLACGHHATERYGAPAVASHVANALGLSHEFIEVHNPA
jgi:dinuclear metal center YbgI/SA1388 family protein